MTAAAELPPTAVAALAALHGRLPGADGVRELLAACRRTTLAAADDWVAAAAAAKHAADDPRVLAEEWASGPLPVLRFLRVLAQPPIAMTPAGRSLALLPDPQLADRWLFAGYRADAFFGHRPARHRLEPTTTLVLGAGNVTSMPLCDALHHVFVNGCPVLCKLSPLHATLLPVFAAALAPLLACGLLQFVVGDGALGRLLAIDPRVGAVHLTGSQATAAAVRREPALAGKRWSAELGNVTPVIVIPGVWNDRELAFQARALAAHLMGNAGCNCVTPRVLLTARSWPQRPAFLARLQAALAGCPPRAPFYAQAARWYEEAAGRPAAADGRLPGLLLPDRDLERDAAHWRSERFAPVLAEIALPGADVDAFARAAVDVANDRCLGSLAAQLAVPADLNAPDRAAVERAARTLRKGTVALNTSPGVAYALMDTPWGAHGGGTADDPGGSGTGFVHGPRVSLLPVDQVILRAPARPWPTPAWLPWHRRGLPALRALARYYATGSRWRLWPVLLHGVRA